MWQVNRSVFAVFAPLSGGSLSGRVINAADDGHTGSYAFDWMVRHSLFRTLPLFKLGDRVGGPLRCGRRTRSAASCRERTPYCGNEPIPGISTVSVSTAQRSRGQIPSGIAEAYRWPVIPPRHAAHLPRGFAPGERCQRRTRLRQARRGSGPFEPCGEVEFGQQAARRRSAAVGIVFTVIDPPESFPGSPEATGTEARFRGIAHSTGPHPPPLRSFWYNTLTAPAFPRMPRIWITSTRTST